MQQHLMTETQLAEMLGKKVRTIKQWRYDGTGPRFFQMTGKKVGYHIKDVSDWIALQESSEDQKQNIRDNVTARLAILRTNASKLSMMLGMDRNKIYTQLNSGVAMTPKRVEWLGVLSNIDPDVLRGDIEGVGNYPTPPKDVDWLTQTKEALEVLGMPGNTKKMSHNSESWLEHKKDLWWFNVDE